MKDTTNKIKIDRDNWKRKDHFDFFVNFEQPFWGLTTEIDCSAGYLFCKENKIPFSTFYLFKSLRAANVVEEFRQRIEDGDIFEYEKISGSVTVLREDETFGFAYFNYEDDFSLFRKSLEGEIKTEKGKTGLKPGIDLNSVIHYSVIPLARFSSFQHAQRQDRDHSVPKIVFGKFHLEGEKVFLPFSIHVHHALCDGLHVGRFVTAFENEMNLIPEI